jgi:hypothetical protein
MWKIITARKANAKFSGSLSSFLRKKIKESIFIKEDEGSVDF